jgi:RHS repeat-associated protein
MSTIRIAAVSLILSLWGAVAYAGTHHYYYTDPQGTVLARADASGAIIATYDYAPYGTAVASMSPAPNGPGYTGHVNDPDTGLVYMQARYYDPSTGGFLSVDPEGSVAGNIYNFSRYAYANNNPVMNVDPDGRLPQWMDHLFPKGDLFRTTGESIAADAAYVVGAATNNQRLQATAVEGMQEATSEGSGSGAVVALVIMGDGPEGEAAPKGLADGALVCRGGSCSADKFSGGKGVTLDSNGKMNNVSVNSANGKSLTQLTNNLPHSKVGVTTVGAVREAGGDVIASPSKANPDHATLQGITPHQAQQLMTPAVKNPNVQ